MSETSTIESMIWNIADYARDAIDRKDYNKIVLPFSLLRRLECALEPTRDAVVAKYEEKKNEWGDEDDKYCTVSGYSFYNISPIRLKTIGNQTLAAMKTYVESFSPNVREIFQAFDFESVCSKLDNKNLLYEVCKKFSAIDLGTDVVSDRDMTNIYEHLIQKFGDEIAEDAEDFMTPRDIVRLSVNMLFANEEDILEADKGNVRTLYDQTCGTCGFISDALDQIEEWKTSNKLKHPTVIVPYGQEINDTTWAMGKAALLLRNVSNDDNDIYDQTKDLSEHILKGDTLNDDQFGGQTFDFQLSNPPYGKKFEVEYKDVMDEHDRYGYMGRFGAGVPSVDDGSMLFLQNAISKMRPAEEGGGKIGIILSASPLFTGKPGSAPSNIRRWILQNDYLDCVVKLSTGEFYRTGINTYLWVLTNKKPEERKGFVQLIDATEHYHSMRSNIGNKNREMNDEDIAWVVKTYVDGHNGGKSVMVPYTDFMFRRVTTQRPLREMIRLSADKLDEFKSDPKIAKLTADNMNVLVNGLTEADGSELKPYSWAGEFAKNIRKKMEKPNVAASVIEKEIISIFGVKDSSYEPVTDKNGEVVPDPELKDTEDIPWGMDFNDYMAKEVLPFAQDAWIDESVTDTGNLSDHGIGVVGTNISFNRYFYHYEEPRKPDDIAKEIVELEKGLGSFEEEFLK